MLLDAIASGPTREPRTTRHRKCLALYEFEQALAFSAKRDGADENRFIAIAGSDRRCCKRPLGALATLRIGDPRR